jgi:hypothetical protein
MRRQRVKRVVGEIAAMPILDNHGPHEIMDDLDAL